MRHPIPARNVVGHSDVAPRRKQDPGGELFPWVKLAAIGVGLWAAPAAVPHWGMAATVEALARYGYDTAAPHAAIAAFQRHFRQKRVDGLPDRAAAEILAGLLKAAGDHAPFA